MSSPDTSGFIPLSRSPAEDTFEPLAGTGTPPEGSGSGFVPLFGGGPSPEPEVQPRPSPKSPAPTDEAPVEASTELEGGSVDPASESQELEGAGSNADDEGGPADGESDEPEEESEFHDGEYLRAREEAFEAARRAGMEAGKAEMAAQIANLQALLDEVAGLRRQILEHSVEDVATATMEIAQRLLRRELSVGIGDIEGLVREILTDLRADDEIIVQIAPEDDRLMREGYPSLLAHVGRKASLRMEPSANITPGGVIIETNFGTVDATVEARFDAFAESVQVWAREAVESLDD